MNTSEGTFMGYGSIHSLTLNSGSLSLSPTDSSAKDYLNDYSIIRPGEKEQGLTLLLEKAKQAALIQDLYSFDMSEVLQNFNWYHSRMEFYVYHLYPYQTLSDQDESPTLVVPVQEVWVRLTV